MILGGSPLILKKKNTITESLTFSMVRVLL